MKAILDGVVIADSNQTIVIERNHYFPPESVNFDCLRASRSRTECPWKGTAFYYDVVVDGKEQTDAAWTYPAPKPAAARIKNHVAFWKRVAVVE